MAEKWHAKRRKDGVYLKNKKSKKKSNTPPYVLLQKKE